MQPRRKVAARNAKQQLAERERRSAQELAVAEAKATQAATEAEADAYEGWKDGRVVPHRITQALDLRGLYGPEVDEACGAKEPDVDLWEAGKKYPLWHQLKLLAKLTDFDIRFFIAPKDRPVFALGPGKMFICRQANPVVEIPEPVLAVTPEAVAEAMRPRFEQTAIPL